MAGMTGAGNEAGKNGFSSGLGSQAIPQVPLPRVASNLCMDMLCLLENIVQECAI